MRRKNWYDSMKSVLKKYDVLQLKYENIYINKTELKLLTNYLNIMNPLHLHLLDYAKKYRKDRYQLAHDFERKNII